MTKRIDKSNHNSIPPRRHHTRNLAPLLDLTDPLNQVILGLAFVAGWLLLGFLDRNDKTSNKNKTVRPPISQTSLLNHTLMTDADLKAIDLHLKTAIIQTNYKRLEIQKDNLAGQINSGHSNDTMAPLPSDLPVLKGPNLIHQFLSENEVFEENISDQTPEDKVNQLIAAENWSREYDQAYEKAFVDNFIQNAEKDGLRVVLDTNYNIVEISPIPDIQRIKTYRPSR